MVDTAPDGQAGTPKPAATAKPAPARPATDTVDSVNSASTALNVARIRGVVARVLWIVCLVLALVIAAAAFSYALEANQKNDLVKLIQSLADRFDLGWFDLDNPVKDFKGSPNSEVKNALFNYGIAAVVYLVVGRFIERIVRP